MTKTLSKYVGKSLIIVGTSLFLGFGISYLKDINGNLDYVGRKEAIKYNQEYSPPKNKKSLDFSLIGIMDISAGIFLRSYSNSKKNKKEQK